MEREESMKGSSKDVSPMDETPRTSKFHAGKGFVDFIFYPRRINLSIVYSISLYPFSHKWKIAINIPDDSGTAVDINPYPSSSITHWCTMITYISKRIRTNTKYVCIPKPRRFGKTSVLNMLGAYDCKAYDVKALYATMFYTMKATALAVFQKDMKTVKAVAALTTGILYGSFESI